MSQPPKHSTPQNHADVEYPDLSATLGAEIAARERESQYRPAKRGDAEVQYQPHTSKPKRPTPLTIKEMPADERPREKLISKGAAVLSNAELLAIILRTGRQGETVVQLATRLLKDSGGWPGLLRADFKQLRSTAGLGEVKACELLAVMEIGRRLLQDGPEQKRKIGTPADLADWLMLEMGGLPQEHLRVLQLNTRNQLTGHRDIYIGTINQSSVRPAELFKDAVRDHSAAILLVHNHPSGDPTPSPEDIRMTAQIVEAGRILDIEVVDHIIVGDQQYVSMRERRLGFGH